ncbi:hypothetical protein T01_5702 [Trichinella spiralis]|uniref:Uncharacterized protein n=1 Tax=Trichinella spiralis TaxID=6334 RepID=A0A0V1AWJ6_TRISP|nr:hypothetical protein T01_5702 [Trichinella spiralis]
MYKLEVYDIDADLLLLLPLRQFIDSKDTIIDITGRNNLLTAIVSPIAIAFCFVYNHCNELLLDICINTTLPQKISVACKNLEWLFAVSVPTYCTEQLKAKAFFLIIKTTKNVSPFK